MTSSLPSTASDAFICPLLKTGRNGSSARFNRARYQLELSHEEGNKEIVDLGFSGSRVLERLLQSPGSVVSREELMSYAWENRVVGQGSLSQQIYTLRQLLCDSRNQIIQTLPRRGYLFNPQYLHANVATSPAHPPAPVTVLPIAPRPTVAAEKPAPAARPAANSVPPKHSAPSRTMAWLAGVVLVLLTGLGLLGSQLAKLSEEPFFTHQRDVGGLEVVYVEGSQRRLNSLIAATEQAVEKLSTLADKPVQLIVNLSPGFYEIHCLQGKGTNWLKIHQSQIRTVTSEFLQRCLQ